MPDKVWCYSQSAAGSSVTNDLDLLAPADKITTTDVGGGSISTSGTSLASPHAAGVAVLLRKALPNLSMAELENRLKLAGKWIKDDLNDADNDTYRWTQRVDARVALLTNDAADYDGDGCTNGQEFGSDRLLGGQRNPLNPYDYMNPSHDGANRIDDILLTVGQYFVDYGEPGYNADTDRTLLGPNPWTLGPPDGTQRVVDIVAALGSYFHDCA